MEKYKEITERFEEIVKSNNVGKVILMKETTWIDKIIFNIIIKLLGKLSFEDFKKLLGTEEEAQILNDWYFNNRHR